MNNFLLPLSDRIPGDPDDRIVTIPTEIIRLRIELLGTVRPVYRTGVSLLSRERFLCI